MKTLLIAAVLAAPAAAQNAPYLVADINPGTGSSSPDGVTVAGDQIFFAADDGTNFRQPWVSDGTAAGTHMIQAILPFFGSFMGEYTALGDLLMFNADTGSGLELWRSDGTAAGTYALTNSFPPAYSLLEFQGYIFFSAEEQLWRSDGTLAGTAEFKQLGVSQYGANPDPGVVVGDRFFFGATDTSSSGRELYVCDGTVAGTYMVKDVNPGTDNSTGPQGIGFNDVYYWSAQDGATGKELWRSDGTAAGTWRVKDIRPGLSGSDPRNFGVAGGKLFFSADDGVNGKELWVTDGTEAGTVLVKAIYPGTSFVPHHVTQLTDVNGTLFFYADNLVNGGELWTSDGTAAGTQMVVDLTPGSPECQLDNAFSVGNAFFFTARSPSFGNELYRSDGTAAGTVPVFDLWTGSGWSSPSDFAFHGDLMYFAAADSAHRRELFAMKLCELQQPEVYCTAGTTASGCQASISASGIPSAGSPSGFVIDVAGSEGNKDGLFFFAENGRQASPWGSSSSYQCVVPPVKRTAVQPGGGTNGACDGAFQLDFNALITAVPAKAPAVGATVQLQCWFRDPFSASNQTTSLSDALEFTLCP